MNSDPRPQIQFDRLLTLADHLQSNRRGHKVFDFSVYNAGAGAEHGCGTHGCAIGELPFAFPEDFTFVTPIDNIMSARTSMPAFRGHTWVSTVAVRSNASAFFGITTDEYDYLFVPSEEFGDEPLPGEQLPDIASADDVASHIRSFVATMRNRIAAPV